MSGFLNHARLGDVTVQVCQPGMPPGVCVPPTSLSTASSAFVPAGTMPGQNPASAVAQNLAETQAQWAASPAQAAANTEGALATTTTTPTTSTDFIVTLPGGSTFDLTTFWNQYWWAVLLGGAVLLFWPSGGKRR